LAARKIQGGSAVNLKEHDSSMVSEKQIINYECTYSIHLSDRMGVMQEDTIAGLISALLQKGCKADLRRMSRRRIEQLVHSARSSSSSGIEVAKLCNIISYCLARGKWNYAYEISGSVDIEKLDAELRLAFIYCLIRNGSTEIARSMLDAAHWNEERDLYFLAEAIIAQREGRMSASIEMLERALKEEMSNRIAYEMLLSMDSNNQTLLAARARKLVNSGREAEALYLYEKLLEVNCRTEEVLTQAGMLLADNGKLEMAELLLREAAGKSDSVCTLTALGTVLFRQRKYDDVIDCFERLISKGYRLKDDTAAMLAESYIRKGTPGMFFSHQENGHIIMGKEAESRIGNVMLESGFLKELLKFTDKASPSDGVALDLRIRALIASGRTEEAISLSGSSDEGKLRLITELKLKGNADLAAGPIQDLLKKGKRDESLISAHIECMKKEGRGKEAVETYRNFIRRRGSRETIMSFISAAVAAGMTADVLMGCALAHPCNDDMQIMPLMAVSLERLGRKKVAEKTFRTLFEQTKNREALELLHDFYFRNGYFAAEEMLLHDAEQMGLLGVDLTRRLAEIQLQKGEFENCISLLTPSVDADIECRILCARAMLGLGRIEDARKNLTVAQEMGYALGETHLLLGNVEIRAGRDNEALEHFRKAAEYEPGNMAAKMNLAMLLEKRGDVVDACAIVDEIAPGCSSEVAVEKYCLDFYSRNNQTEKCLELSESLIRRNRSDHIAWNRRGISLFSLARYKEAAESLQTASKFYESVDTLQMLKEAYIAQKDFKSALDTVERIVHIDGESKGSSKERIILLMKLNREEEALGALRRYRKTYGNDAEIVLFESEILHSRKNYEEELSLLTECAGEGKAGSPLLLQMSRCYLELRRYTDAIEFASRAVEADDRDVRARLLRCKIFKLLGREEDAYQDCEAALSIEHENLEALKMGATLRIARADYDGAFLLLSKAKSVGIEDGGMELLIGKCLLRQKKFEEALSSFTIASEKAGEKDMAELGRGICLFHMGRLNAASIALDSARKRNPSNAGAYYYLGLCLKAKGLNQRAIEYFEKAAELDEGLQPAWREIGEQHIQAGEFEKAEEPLTRAVELKPGDTAARELLQECRKQLIRRRNERYALSLLRLEYRMERNPTREEAVSLCRIPVEELDSVFEMLSSPASLRQPEAGSQEWQELEELSAEVLQKCFKNRNTAAYGVRLCDITVNYPQLSLEKAKQLFEFISSAEQPDAVNCTVSGIDALILKASRLPAGERGIVGIVKNLRVGIHSARAIERELSIMKKIGYSTDYVYLDRDGEGRKGEQMLHGGLYGQFYGEQTTQRGDTYETCGLHGNRAIGSCSACQANMCHACLEETGGQCPNCGAIMLEGEGEGATAQ